MVFPCFVGLPLGFSWALHFAQVSNSEVASKAELSDSDVEALLDGRRSPNLAAGKIARSLYVDNCHLVGLDESRVNDHYYAAADAFRGSGLVRSD